MFNPPVPHPFSSSATDERWVLVSGVGGHAPDGSIAADPAQQVRDTLENVAALLQQAGSRVEEIIWFRPYVTERQYAPVLDDILREWLRSPPPAAGALLVTDLIDPRMIVEVEAWAHRGAERQAAA